LSGNVGHFSNTYAADTYGFPQVNLLFWVYAGTCILINHTIDPAVGISDHGGVHRPFAMASALEGLSRVVLGGGRSGCQFHLGPDADQFWKMF